MLTSNVRPVVLAMALALGASGVIAPAVRAQGQAQEIKVPETVEDHLALAKAYEQKAATYRQEADYHRHMVDAYKKRVATSPKSTQPNPWVTKMQQHCQKLARDADKLADDSEEAARYHKLRAKELQGG